MKQLFIVTLAFLFVAKVSAHDFEVDGIYYNITSSTALTVEVTYKGSSYSEYSNEYSGAVAIPSSVTYSGTTYSVTSIGIDAFRGCTGLTSITIPNSVTSMGIDAFRGCTGLTSITIPNSVTSMGSRAFSGCTGLTSITIPNSVTSIGSSAFYNCTGLTSVTIPNSVTSIGDSAFYGCTGLTSVTIPNSVTSIVSRAFYGCKSLTSITIPNSVTSIGDSAFYGCTGLTAVHITDLAAWWNIDFRDYSSNPFYYAHNLYLNGEKVVNFVIPEGVTAIKNSMFSGCTDLTSITIPNSVTSIGDYAFYGCKSLTSITIPNSVTSMGNYAFYGCKSLTSITIPNNVTNIGEDAFRGCSGLTSVTIPNNVTNIGSAAFYGCIGLTSITIPNSVTSIGSSAFYNCTGLTSVTIPNSVTSIGSSAFYNCTGLTSVTIPNSVTSIGDYAFYYCISLTGITIPNSVTSIGDYAFYDCKSLTGITIPNSVTSIGSSAFSNCYSLTSITIPNSVTSIGSSAFYNCTGLKGVTIPNSVTSIGKKAFYYCISLTNVTIGNSVTNIGNSAFYYCTGLKEVINFSNLTFAKGSTDYGYIAYFADRVANIPNGSIEGDFMFAIVDGVNTLIQYLGDGGAVTLPDSYKGGNYAIGADVFKNNKTIKSVTISKGVTSIGYQAFYGCYGLKEVINYSNLTFSKGSTNNGYVAYYADRILNIPNASINGDFAFGVIDGVNTLTGYLGTDSVVTLPDSYKGEGYVIGSSAFQGCAGLTSITIPGSVTSIEEDAFCGCKSLKEVHITDLAAWCNIDFCDDDANPLCYAKNLYLNGEKVTNLVIPDGVTTIKNRAFEDCKGLTSITIPNSVTSIGYEAFQGCTGLTSITIPNSVTSIGTHAFEDCTGLTSITIPGSVTSIGQYAFHGCNSLTSITIPNSVTSIGSWAFEDCTGLTSITIPNSVTSIGDSAFRGCTGLTSITIPNSVTSIGSWAFEDCTGLTSVVIGNSVASIEWSAFEGCTRLKEVRIEDGEGTLSLGYNDYNGGSVVGEGLFYDCPLETLYLGRNLSYSPGSSYGYSPFYGITTLKSVTVGNSVTSIGSSAFRRCTGLTSITIPNSVTSIGDYAFSGCTGLKEVINFSNLTFTKGSTGYGHVAYYADRVINIPGGSIEGDFVFVVVDGVNTLVAYLGDGGAVTLPDSYKGEAYVIGSDVFKNNTTITSITISSGVAGIEESAFYGCNGLKEVRINDLAAWCGINFANPAANPLYYAENLYLKGKLLTTISIPKVVEEIKDYAFYNCTGVVSVNILDNVKVIGNSAFYGCSSLEALYIGNGITTIGDYAFDGCNNLLEIKVASKYARTESENIFTADAYGNACLYVPIGRKFAYEKTTPWNKFYIVEAEIKEPETEEGALGDVNGDNKVDVGDVTILIGMIPDASLLTDSGDINGDNKVDVGDVTTLVAIILGTNNTPARAAAMEEYNVELSIEGDEQSLTIDATATDYPYSAVQFDVYLPAGVKAIGNMVVGCGNAAAYKEQADGAVRVVIYSPSNTAIANKSASIAIDATGLALGSHPVEVKNIILAAPGRAKAIAWDSTGYITIAGTTGIDGVVSDAGNADAVVYDLQGHRVTEIVKGRVYIKNGSKFIAQ